MDEEGWGRSKSSWHFLFTSLISCFLAALLKYSNFFADPLWGPTTVQVKTDTAFYIDRWTPILIGKIYNSKLRSEEQKKREWVDKWVLIKSDLSQSSFYIKASTRLHQVGLNLGHRRVHSSRTAEKWPMDGGEDCGNDDLLVLHSPLSKCEMSTCRPSAS